MGAVHRKERPRSSAVLAAPPGFLVFALRLVLLVTAAAATVGASPSLLALERYGHAARLVGGRAPPHVPRHGLCLHLSIGGVAVGGGAAGRRRSKSKMEPKVALNWHTSSHQYTHTRAWAFRVRFNVVSQLHRLQLLQWRGRSDYCMVSFVSWASPWHPQPSPIPPKSLAPGLRSFAAALSRESTDIHLPDRADRRQGPAPLTKHRRPRPGRRRRPPRRGPQPPHLGIRAPEYEPGGGKKNMAGSNRERTGWDGRVRIARRAPESISAALSYRRSWKPNNHPIL